MPTNSIGKGNALVGICLPVEVKRVLGPVATEEDRSLANLIFNAALEHWRSAKPALASQIEAAREQHLRLRSGAVCLIIGLASLAHAFVGDIELRRTASYRVRPPSIRREA